MAEKTTTAFIRSPQPLPSTLRDAFCACAMYASQTSHNLPVIRQVLSEVSTSLMVDVMYLSFEEELANVQASLLLQIIQLFDGDEQYRSVGECYIDAFRQKVLHLQRREAEELSPDLKAKAYERWLFMENVRRTILTATLVEGVYTNVKEGVCKTVPFLSMLPITVSGKLWEARSEKEWAALRKVVPLTVLPYGEAVGWWREEATRGTLEELQQILFVACKGTRDLNSRLVS
jgi:hypothetical protein